MKHNQNNKPLKVILFKSRNKDNKHLDHFKERTKAFLSDQSYEQLEQKFQEFTNQSQQGEFSRFYMSVNNRNNDAIKKELIIALLKDDHFQMTQVMNKLVSVASQSKSRNESKWLFDFDEDEIYIGEFLTDLATYVDKSNIHVYNTPNNHAIITDRGFDTRQLLEKWQNVTLMRDDMLCVSWSQKVV